eukprot:s268_g25.t1
MVKWQDVRFAEAKISELARCPQPGRATAWRQNCGHPSCAIGGRSCSRAKLGLEGFPRGAGTCGSRVSSGTSTFTEGYGGGRAQWSRFFDAAQPLHVAAKSADVLRCWCTLCTQCTLCALRTCAQDKPPSLCLGAPSAQGLHVLAALTQPFRGDFMVIEKMSD